jgi:hypothetical protein
VGQEITRVSFSADEFRDFAARLSAETALLERTMRAGSFDECPVLVAGCEIEGWLLDRHYFPVADNEAFLARLHDPLVVPELSRFNIELNCAPRALRGEVFETLRVDLEATWSACQAAAHVDGDVAVVIGTLPTLRESDLSMANVSPLNRYRALNEQVMRARGGAPIRIDIEGRDHLRRTHDDVMLEAGTTSFQLHLQIPFSAAVRYYNAAQLLAAPMVAIASNSPFLFGHDLWAETRVPLFEQAVATSDTPGSSPRVTFGDRWLVESPFELFADNLARFPPLLPLLMDEPPHHFAHLRLHNGTIWRWNRLLIGVDGAPGVRIEHRVMAAGPTFLDMLANAALFYGAVNFLANLRDAPERLFPFGQARQNFYAAARHGLDAEIAWLGGTRRPLAALVAGELVPMAREGLRQLEVASSDVALLLDVIAQRALSGRTGAWWQRAYLASHPRDFGGLVARYVEHQRQGNPVHEWEL